MRPPKCYDLFRTVLVLVLLTVCYSAPQGSHYDRLSRPSFSGYSRSPIPQKHSYTTANLLTNNYNRYSSYGRPSMVATTDKYTSYRSPSATAPSSYSRYNRPRTTASVIADRYSSKRFPSQDTKSLSPRKNTASNADVENAKFAGVHNQESFDTSESTKTLLHIKRKYNRQRPYRNRCFPYGRDATAQRVGVTPPPQEQGRFLWDVNVYNVYPQRGPLYGCGGLGGGLGTGGIFGDYVGGGGYGDYGGYGGLGGGLLSDPIVPAFQPTAPLNNFLSLFAPGILQNALAATVPPPRPQADPVAANDELSDLQSDPAVDPSYRPAPPPRRRPNPVYYDSAGAPAITPAQLVGGVATTVNGIIQQLTGNVQPVYPTSYRRSSYG